MTRFPSPYSMQTNASLSYFPHSVRFISLLNSSHRTIRFVSRFPPWRHCFHWMAGMLEAAGLRDVYEGLRQGLNGIKMK